MRSPVTVFACHGDFEAHWIAAQVLAQEMEYQLYQAELDLELSREANALLCELEPEFWASREATDPYWPPPECDPTDEGYAQSYASLHSMLGGAP